jgi:hypothetical protein
VQNIAEQALTEAVLAALEKKVGSALKTHRTSMQDALEGFDIEKLGVRLPDGTKVASIVGVNPDPTPVVADEDALIEWVSQHAPDEIVTRTVVVTEIRPAYRTALFDEMTKRKAPETVTGDGEIVEVPGIKMRESTRSHQVRFEDGDTGRDLVAAAWAAGDLSHLTELRALTGGGQ